jgi:hypothetical protein
MKYGYALIVTCLVAPGCGDSRPASIIGPTTVAGTTAPVGAYTLSGTIRDLDGVPLAGVTLAIAQPNEGRSVVSDAAGRYSLHNVSGLIYLRVSKEGYFESSITRFVAGDQVADMTLSALLVLVPGTTLRGTVRGDPCDPVGWDARALCQRIFFTVPSSGMLDLVLTWDGPSELDMLVDGQYFDPPRVPGEIHARVPVAPDGRHEIRINSYYVPQAFDLRSEFQSQP